MKKGDFVKMSKSRRIGGILIPLSQATLWVAVAILCNVTAVSNVFSTGDDYTSDGIGGWSTADTWDVGSTIPGDDPDDTVTIDGHTIGFIADTDVTIKELTITNDGILNMTASDGKNLEATTSVTITGSDSELNISQGKLTTATLTNAGVVDVTNNGNTNKGVLKADSITNTGTININGSSAADFSTTTSIDNQANSNLNFSNFTGNVKPATFTNVGTILLDASHITFGAIANTGGTISLVNNSIATFDDDTTNTIAGTLSLNKSTATFNAAATNTISGAVELHNGSTLGSAGTTLILDNGSLNISGAGNKIESDLEVTGTLTIENNAKANHELAINGMMTGADVTFDFRNVNVKFGENALDNLSGTATVASGTTLGGLGNSAVDFIFNSGSFHAPGNSPATFAAKSVDYKSGSIVYIEAGKNNTWDKVVAEGNINFADGVTIYLLNWDLNGQDAQDVFIADNAGSGTAKIQLGGEDLDQSMVGATNANEVEIVNTSSNTMIVKSIAWNSNDALTINGVTATDTTLGFDVTGTSTGGPSNLPVNIATLSKVVLLGMPGSDLQNAIGAYAGSDGDKLLAAIAQLDPVALSLGGRITHDTVSRFNRMNFARLQRLQDAGMPLYASMDRYDGMVVRGQNVCCPNSGGLWFEMLGSFASQGDRDGIAGYSSDTIGFGVGLDGRLSRNFVAGFGFGGSFTQADVKQGLGKNSVDNYLMSLYGGYTDGGWTVNIAGGYAHSSLKSSRYASLIDGYAHGSRGADTGYGSFEINYRFGNRQSYFTPFYALDFIAYNEKGYTETGHLINMQVNSNRVNGCLQTFGTRIGTSWRHDNGWIFNPEFTVGWIHDYGDGAITTTGKFVEGGTPFTVIGASRNNDRALLGLGLNTMISSNLTTFARYDGELAGKYNNQTVQAGFNVKF